MRRHSALRCGVPADCFRRPGTHAAVVPEQLLDRVTLFRAPRATLVALPPVPQADAALVALGEGNQAPLDADGVVARLPDWGLAPHYRDYILAFPPELAPAAEHPQVHGLDSSDRDLLDALFAACDERERRAARIDIADPFVIGFWQADHLLGAASLRMPGPDVADIGVLVRPRSRRRGVAMALVRQIAGLAVRMGRCAQVRMAHDNAASLAVARRCGFALALVEEGLRAGKFAADRELEEPQKTGGEGW